MRRSILLLAVLLPFIVASPAEAHWKPGAHNAVHAIVDVFPTRYEHQALDVAYCEGSAFWWLNNRPKDARNGQYRSFFQMGESERRLYGDSPVWPYHGFDPWSHARAAYRYFAASGYDWSPWSCKPWPSTYYNPMPRFLWAPVLR
jgi:hypothetical protein